MAQSIRSSAFAGQPGSPMHSGSVEDISLHSGKAASVRPDETPVCGNLFQDDTLLSELRGKFPKTTPPLPSEPKLRHPPPGNANEAWQSCSRLVEKYDAGLCQTYREQIDTLLVFAGLFSAVVTAFTVESYQWLQDDPNEKTAELLALIANLLAPNHSTANPHPVASPVSDSAVARINVYWFLALTLSLTSALVGILCKQWVREYERDVGRSHEQALGVRQMKFEGIDAWRVGDMVSSVPLLLQLALALFMIGILELLWRLHTMVAATVTTVAGLTLLFYTATSFMPLIQYLDLHFRRRGYFLRMRSQCPYKSPQAWLALRSVLYCVRLIRRSGFAAFDEGHSWLSFDLRWTALMDNVPSQAKYPFRALAWLVQTVELTELPSWIWHCLWDECRSDKSTPNHNATYTNVDHVLTASSVLDEKNSLKTLGRPEMKSSALQAQWLLLVYLVEVQWGPGFDSAGLNTAVELFLRTAGRRPNVQWSAKCLRRIEEKLHPVSYRPGHRFDENLATALFELVERLLAAHQNTDKRETISSLTSIVLCTIGLLRRSHELREELMAAICVCAMRWLRSVPQGPTDSSKRLERHCALKAGEIVRRVLVHYQYDLQLKPVDLQHTPYIHVLAALARYSAETWRATYTSTERLNWDEFQGTLWPQYYFVQDLLRIAGSTLVVAVPPPDHAQRASDADFSDPALSQRGHPARLSQEVSRLDVPEDGGSIGSAIVSADVSHGRVSVQSHHTNYSARVRTTRAPTQFDDLQDWMKKIPAVGRSTVADGDAQA